MPEPGKTSQSRRQIVNFSFFRVMPEWRRLSIEERHEDKQEALRVLQRWNCEDMRILTYSTAGLRSECDMMLWRICYSLDCLSSAHTDFMKTRLGGYLETSHSFLGMTKLSQYVIGRESDAHSALRGYIKPGGTKYLTVYPFSKTREWYHRPFEDRQRIVHEQIKATQEFPRVRLNTIYTIGLEDYELVIALETDHPEDLVDMSLRLREVENSLFIAHDVPRITCLRTSPEEMLERLG